MRSLVKRLVLQVVRKGLSLSEADTVRFHGLAHLKRLLSEHEINCFINVGANRGQIVRFLNNRWLPGTHHPSGAGQEGFRSFSTRRWMIPLGRASRWLWVIKRIRGPSM